ncbi:MULTISPECIES: MFS transporter [Bacillus cereus group]|uniref:MFS transporter n=1 Tax=Bacillus cereus group TaxID=86661 RepID=UPI0011EDCC5C|nr:MFS transporter [Bacillus sp. JAS24-2]QEL82590.1 MFS transporter [Bacillus sp. JAS24-2]
MNSFSVLKNRNFSSFFIASLISMFGEGIFSLTSIVIVAKDTNSVMAISYMLIITMLPSVFLSPIAGVIIDRFNKAKIAIICSVLRFIFIMIIPLSSYFGFFSVSILYVSIFFSYIIWYILGPTTESMIKQILKEDEYMQGTSFTQAAWQVGLLSSAIIAGSLLKHVGTSVTLIVAGSVYLIGAFIYMRMLHLYSVRQKDTFETTSVKEYLLDIKQGWIYFGKNKGLFYIALTACIATPFFSAINILIAPFNYEILNGNELTLGVIDSAAGIGSFISVGLCLWLAKKKETPYYLMLSFVLLGSFTILFSLSNTYPVAFVIYILIGFFVGNVKVLSKSLVYKYTHDHFIGRIMTTISMLSLALGIIVSLVIGYIGEKNIINAYCMVGIFLIIPVILTGLGVYELKKEKSIV